MTPERAFKLGEVHSDFNHMKYAALELLMKGVNGEVEVVLRDLIGLCEKYLANPFGDADDTENFSLN